MGGEHSQETIKQNLYITRWLILINNEPLDIYLTLLSPSTH